MRERPNRPTGQYPTVSNRQRAASQRNMLIGVGAFVAIVVIVGGLLLAGGGDGDDDDQGAIATNTRSSSPASTSSGAVGSTSTSADGQTAVPSPDATLPAGQGFPTVTPATAGFPTVTPSDTEAEVPTEELVDPEATDDTGTEDPEATEDTGVVEEPTEEPIIGDFGQLPPVQIVSGGLDRNIDLDFVLDGSTFAAPDVASVYEIQWKSWTEDEMALIAANLAIENPVENLGGGSFQVAGSDAGVFVGPTPQGHPILQYESYVDPADDPLPDDDTLVNLAYAFLVDSGIVNDAGTGVVTDRDDDTGFAVVNFKPDSPAPLLAAYPSATVTFAAGGLVRTADVRWAAEFVASDYSLRATSAMWNDVLAGEASMEADLSELPEGDLTGTFTVTDIGTAYSIAGVDYLAPVVVFYGDIYVPEADMTIPMRIYVQAVAGQDAPAG